MMKRAMLPLLLVMTMALLVSSAMATKPIPIGGVPGWITSGNWNGNSPEAGTGGAYASHPVTIGPSGAFSYDVSFTIGNVANEMGAGIKDAGGNAIIRLSYANGMVLLNGNNISRFTPDPSTTYHAIISTEDGSLYHIDICGISRGLTFEGAPAQMFLELLTKAGAAPAITSVSFDVPTPTLTPTLTPSDVPDVTPAPESGPIYDPQQVQNFYANIYPQIGSPYDTVTYNPDGTYNVTKGYPVSEFHDVSGIVTGAADGKPIAGASVVLGNAMQKTDSTGKYLFESIPTGIDDIAVSADGFASKTQSINVIADLTLNFALNKASAGNPGVASAANETNMTTNNTVPANTTVVPTTVPSPTQTKSPGFEGIAAAIAMIGAAGALVYMNRKH
jgi:hypothetical protein